jgi:hypothetical protein
VAGGGRIEIQGGAGEGKEHGVVAVGGSGCEQPAVRSGGAEIATPASLTIEGRGPARSMIRGYEWRHGAALELVTTVIANSGIVYCRAAMVIEMMIGPVLAWSHKIAAAQEIDAGASWRCEFG